MDEAIVYAIDDDPATLDAVAKIARSLHLRCRPYTSGLDFLEQYDRSLPGCVVTELRMMAISGLQIQRRLLLEGTPMPVVFLASQADVATVVSAMRDGAVHFLQKPFREQELWDAIQEAIQISKERLERQQWLEATAKRIASLTPKERQVLELIGQDMAKRAIASELGVCTRTVEMHRAKLMGKLQVETVSALKRIAEVAASQSALLDSDRLGGGDGDIHRFGVGR
ncbi:MAG: response regulator transcription factor [Pirellulales bacterium]|nr:response regulator transcription factor [Pirellulales bacterium]